MTAEQIKELRLKLILNQTEFGEIFGVTFVTISRWENGECRPRCKHLRKMKELNSK